MIKLIGIDPGIVDTAMTVISLDYKKKRWEVTYHVWEGVTKKDGLTVVVRPEFLDNLGRTIAREKEYGPRDTYIFVEGFRQRGRDTQQDRKMLALVQAIKNAIPGIEVIDNTGIKKIATEDMLKLFRAHRFPSTNHSDIKSAARVALVGAIKDNNLNPKIADFIAENLGVDPWEYASM